MNRFLKTKPVGVSVAWPRPMNDRNDDDTFEPELDGFPTDLDPRRVRSRVQIEVLASEYADKARQGQNPSIDSYVERYPDMEAQIRELFPMVAALEQWKSDRESEVLRAQLPDQFKLKQLGDCRLVREIGRGGMGVVFEALEGSIERQVAVNCCRGGFRWCRIVRNGSNERLRRSLSCGIRTSFQSFGSVGMRTTRTT